MMMQYFVQDTINVQEITENGDLALMTKVASGDPSAQRELAERLFDRVRRTMSYLVFGDEAQDLAQTALIQILRSARSFRGESSLECWADKIATRTLFKQREKDRRRHNLKAKDWEPPPIHISTDEEIESLRARRRLSALLAELPDIHRVSVVLHYIGGHPIKEIAAITGVPVNTVRGRLRSGRKKIETLIQRDPLLKEWTSRREK